MGRRKNGKKAQLVNGGREKSSVGSPAALERARQTGQDAHLAPTSAKSNEFTRRRENGPLGNPSYWRLLVSFNNVNVTEKFFHTAAEVCYVAHASASSAVGQVPVFGRQKRIEGQSWCLRGLRDRESVAISTLVTTKSVEHDSCIASNMMDKPKRPSLRMTKDVGSKRTKQALRAKKKTRVYEAYGDLTDELSRALCWRNA
ncbi:uncharacterized protein UTRI_05532 [Ustilago trichophora]|uniref:Uncharacterized protein n=1 Tax=Ustilago trichophora TaxID=86804 RepID=A0A5C3EHE8_9BASI|nr:uncharacterized protein UTRI_05532 [Ustilago trichophora]